MSQKALITSFEILNGRRRKDPAALSPDENRTWQRMREEIEKLLFKNQPVSPCRRLDFLQVPVDLDVFYEGSQGRELRKIRVLGEGGCIIATSDPLPVGTSVELELFPLKVGFLCKLPGRVAWGALSQDAKDPGMGVVFIGLTENQARMIFQILDHTVRRGIPDSRCLPRFDTELQLELNYQGTEWRAVTADLSLGGMYVVSHRFVDVGSSFAFRLNLRDSEPISGVAEVVHCRSTADSSKPPGFGVRFLALDSRDVRKLQKYLILVEEATRSSKIR